MEMRLHSSIGPLLESLTLSFILKSIDGAKKIISFYSILANKRNRSSHFKCIKKHKSIPRNYCFASITLFSPKKKICITLIFKLNCFYSKSANRRKQKDWVLWKNMHQRKPRNWENSCSMLQSHQNIYFLLK